MKMLVKGKPESCKECLFYHAVKEVSSVTHSIMVGYNLGAHGGGNAGSNLPHKQQHNIGFNTVSKCSLCNQIIPQNISDNMILNNCPLEEFEEK